MNLLLATDIFSVFNGFSILVCMHVTLAYAASPRVDCFGLLIYVLQRFLLPGYVVISYPCLVVSFIAELGLALWLLIIGAKDQKPTLADGQK